MIKTICMSECMSAIFPEAEIVPIDFSAAPRMRPPVAPCLLLLPLPPSLSPPLLCKRACCMHHGRMPVPNTGKIPVLGEICPQQDIVHRFYLQQFRQLPRQLLKRLSPTDSHSNPARILPSSFRAPPIPRPYSKEELGL